MKLKKSRTMHWDYLARQGQGRPHKLLWKSVAETSRSSVPPSPPGPPTTLGDQGTYGMRGYERTKMKKNFPVPTLKSNYSLYSPGRQVEEEVL